MTPDVGRQGTSERPHISGPVPCSDTEYLTALWRYPEIVESLVRPGVVSPLQAVGGGVVTFWALVNARPATLAPWR